MPLYRASLQTLGAIALLAVALACGGKKGDSASATSALVSGTITYSRVPLATDANGVPTGLVDASVPSNLKSLPARGVVVRAYQQVTQTNPDGTQSLVWTVARAGVTDSTGLYSLAVSKDKPTMVEVLSSFSGGGATQINLVAEPGGINSATPVLNRLRYALRKGADGSPATTSNNAPSSVVSADTVVNFTVGLNDPWWLVNPAFNLANSVVPTSILTGATLETADPSRTPGQGSGSRILGIGDTIASFMTTYTTANPGTTLDLHYWPGRTESRGSYLEFDRSLFPQAYDSSTGAFHFFGSLAGGPANDDAWDEGVILPLIARGVLFGTSSNRTFSVPLDPILPIGTALPNLSPDLARIEGLADAMAANVLKSPYLADTQGATLAAPVKDVRDITGLGAAELTPYSAPAIRAFSWEIILKANSLPSPGLATDWANINPLAASRYFLAPTSLTLPATATTSARDLEPLNIFSQVTRFKETKSALEPVDLAALFTDPVITSLGAPFGITWPRPTAGVYASFVADWGTDPTGTFPSVVLSMAKATQVNGVYPNVSQGEVFYTGFTLTADRRCVLSVVFAPALAAGGEVDMDLPLMNRTFHFSGSGGNTGIITIPSSATAPVYHPVRFRLNSPSTLQPDVTVTLTLTPAP
jgi:hypothetical protein